MILFVGQGDYRNNATKKRPRNWPRNDQETDQEMREIFLKKTQTHCWPRIWFLSWKTICNDNSLEWLQIQIPAIFWQLPSCKCLPHLQRQKLVVYQKILEFYITGTKFCHDRKRIPADQLSESNAHQPGPPWSHLAKADFCNTSHFWRSGLSGAVSREFLRAAHFKRIQPVTIAMWAEIGIPSHF